MSSSEKESIFRGVILYSVPTWINLILGFLSIVVLTRILSPDIYGLVMIFLSSSNVLIYVLTLGMDGAYIRFYNDPPNGESNGQFLYKILVLSLIISLFSFIVGVVIFPGWIGHFVFGADEKNIVACLFIYTISQVVLRFLNINYRMSFNVKMYTIQNILMNCSTRILIILGALILADFLFISIFLTTGIVLVLIVYIIIQRKDFTPVNIKGEKDYSLSLSGYKSFVVFSLFAAPTYIVTYLNVFLGQQIVRSSLDAYALGIFTSTGAFAAILSALKGGFSTYWSAFIYKNYQNENERIGKMHDFIMLFSIIAASLLISLRDVIYLFIGSDFHASKSFFSLLLLFPLLNFVQESTEKGIDIAKKNKYTLFSYICAVAVNLSLCLLLVPILGIKGAAFANAFSAIVLFSMTTYWGQKYYKTIFCPYKSLAGLFIIIILLAIPSFVENIWIIISTTIIFNIIVLFLYKKEYSYLLSRLFAVLHDARIKK